METTHSVLVYADAETAFSVFVERFSAWWPPEYTWSRKALVEIGIEQRIDGKCYEIGPYGFRYDWGRVVDLQAPERVGFTWQISPSRVPEPDPAHSSAVEISFTQGSDAGTTHVTLVHRGFERHGESADAYLEGMASDAGWPYILGRYADVVNSG